MIRRYNCAFEDATDDLSVEIWAYNNWSEKLKTASRLVHFKNAMRLLFCQGNRPALVWTPWTDRRVESFFNEKHFCTWWGPGATGKTTDAAAIALTYFLMHPNETTITVCSTTREMLEARIWGEIMRLYTSLPGLPFTLTPSRFSITVPQSEEIQNTKNIKAGIFGVAVLRGTAQEALSNLSGRHNRYCVLVVDEMQGTKEVAVDAMENIRSGAIEAYFLGMGNPASWFDVLGKYSMPKNGNTKSIGLDWDSWETKEGYCHFFNGLKSPAITEPKKYPFLLKQSDIDRTKRAKGENHPLFWQQRIGFVPPEGILPVMMTATYIMQYRMMDQPEWASAYTTYAALDPAFSSDGDDAVLTPFSIGLMTNGLTGIWFHEPQVIPIQLKADQSMAYTLARDVRDRCKSMGIVPSQFAADTTGMQKLFADILENEWGRGIYRCGFSSAVSDLPEDVDGDQSAKQAYHRRVDELWGSVAAFGRYGQIRGMSTEASQQFSSRLIVSNTPLKLETKKEMKNHFGRSPDHADSIAVAIDFIRMRLGLLAGGGMQHDGSRQEAVARNDIDSREDNYTLSDEQQFAETVADMEQA